MATAGWRTGTPLIDEIGSDCQRFDFYQLVRLLLMGSPREAGLDPLGRLDRTVRFRADTRQDFPPAEVTGYVAPREGERPAELSLSSFCLDNRSGPLPEPYRELLLERTASRDHAMADFLSIFNHRLNALRFLARGKRSVTMQDRPPEQTPQTRALLNLIGLGTPHLLEQLPLTVAQLMAFAGLLANPRRSLAVVRTVVASYLGAEVTIRQFTGHWNRLKEANCTRIGVGGRNQCLGKDTILGNRIWDQHRLITLEIGPVSYEKMADLQVGTTGYRRLRQLLAYLLNRQCDCRVVIKVATEQIPASVLGRRPDNGSTPAAPLYLGRTSWLRRQAAPEAAGIDSQLTYVLTLESGEGKTP